MERLTRSLLSGCRVWRRPLAPFGFWLAMAALLVTSCAVVPPPVGQNAPPQPLPVQEEVPGEASLYAASPEDCLEGEEYDPVEHICYTIVYCDENGVCQEDDASNLDLLPGLADGQDGGPIGGQFEDAAQMAETALVTYTVAGDQISNPELAPVSAELQTLQADVEAQKRVWTYFTQIIPQEQRRLVTKYVVFTDGPDEGLAFVTPETDDPTKWLLAVDIADSGNPEDLTFTLVHEFAHLLTLNNQQVPADQELALQPDDPDLYDQAVAACPTYFPGEGCSRPDSYINQFYQRFWADIYAEWQAIGDLEDEDQQAAAAEAFYTKHQDQFVSEYAASDPGEDMAETFAVFVLKPKPGGNSIADQKVLFFYEFPELVKLRSQITGRLYSRLRRK